jgi:hypothetical protein
MMHHRLASLTLALALLPGFAQAQSKPAAKGAETKAASSKSAAEKPPPKPLTQAQSAAETIKKLPPFLGLFGTEEMLAKHGFRSRPGTFVDFEVDPNSKPRGAGQEHGYRLAEVGPAVPGGRWIEMVSTSSGIGQQGIRILTRGDKSGNLERMIGRAGGLPPMEFPLDTVSIEAIGGGVKGLTDLSLPAKLVGKEVVTTPLGKFNTDHWVVDVGRGHRLEFWFTDDEKIPFSGMVKMVNDEGSVLAAKVGTNATETIAVPPRM